MNACVFKFAFTFLATCAGAVSLAQDSWTHLGGNATRSARISGAIPTLSTLRWRATTDNFGNTVAFTGQAGVVVFESKVYATGRVSPPGQTANQPRLLCFDANTGACLWSVSVAAPALDSFSTPCVDAGNRTVIHGSGRNLVAYAADTGAIVWTRTLTRSIVNASPVVTQDRLGRDRCFITDYDGAGSSGKLYAINVDAFDAATNPFAPGAIVWSAAIGGSSGNSPTYLSGAIGGSDLVFVSTVGNYTEGFAGTLRAYAVDSAPSPMPLWSVESPDGNGFFAGVAVSGPSTIAGLNGAVYAATYAFSGGIVSANLVKADAATGALRWSVPSNRTSSIPVLLSDGRIVLSTGLPAYGSVQAIELFRDWGANATVLWNSAISTWVDADADGLIDDIEYQHFGGWTMQPIVSETAAGARIICGLSPRGTDAYATSNDVFVLSLDHAPQDPGFVIASATGTGASPAVAGGLMFSTGSGGLSAYGDVASNYDVDANGAMGIDDLYAWERGVGSRDVNLDGAVDSTDRAALITKLRERERMDVEAGR